MPLLKAKYSMTAGAGKTTKLIEIYQQALERFPKENILLLSFSRETVNELKDRLMAQFHFRPEDLKNIRTQHSLCFQAFRGEYKVLTKKDVAKFAEETSLALSRAYSDPNDEDAATLETIFDVSPIAIKEDDAHWQDLMLSRLTCSDPKTDVARALKPRFLAWMEKHSLIDFVGMIEKSIERQIVPDHLRVLLVDEAQDMCELLYRHHKMLMERTGCETYWCGDEDQVVYSFMGANPSIFVNEPAEQTILGEVSRRCPEKIVTLANRIIQKNRNRLEKTLSAERGGGELMFVESPTEIHDLLKKWKKNTFWVTSTNKNVAENRDAILEAGLPLALPKDVQTFLDTARIILAGIDTLTMDQIHALTNATLNLYGKERKLFPFNKQFFLKPIAFKKWVESVLHGEEHGESVYKIEDLPLTPFAKDIFRSRSLTGTNLSEEQIAFIENAHTLFSDGWKIQCMTMHRAKGKEADVCVIDLSTSPLAEEAFYSDPEPLRRQLFVALTRAKEKVILYESAPATRKSMLSLCLR